MKTAFWVVIVCGLVCIGGFYAKTNSPDPDAVSREALAKINEYRIEAGLNYLAWDHELAELAEAHSRTMEETGSFQHSSHPYYENILKGGFNSRGGAIAELWQKSPSHYKVMMSRDIHSGAVGIAEGIIQNYATFMAR